MGINIVKHPIETHNMLKYMNSLRLRANHNPASNWKITMYNFDCIKQEMCHWDGAPLIQNCGWCTCVNPNLPPYRCLSNKWPKNALTSITGAHAQNRAAGIHTLTLNAIRTTPFINAGFGMNYNHNQPSTNLGCASQYLKGIFANNSPLPPPCPIWRSYHYF